jgi:hypothetical protein
MSALNRFFNSFLGRTSTVVFVYAKFSHPGGKQKNSVQQIKPFAGKNKCPHYEGEI